MANELVVKVAISDTARVINHNYDELKVSVNSILEKYKGLTLTDENKQDIKKKDY